MEDTDEDFFDKLVDDVDDDQFKITATESSVTNRSDVVHVAKADSSIIGDINNNNYNNKVESTISTGVKEEPVDPGQPLVSDNSFVSDNMVQYIHGTGGSGVKEVQWSAFTSEPLDNTSNVFGSYSDFFTEFDGNFVESTGKGNNFVNNETNVQSVVDYSHQFQESRSYTTSGRQDINGQDLNSTQYWENLYPGWKYDANTGQWYQVNEGYDTTLNAQITDNTSSVPDWNVPNTETAAQSFVGEKSTNESVTSWSPTSQTSQTNESLSNWSHSSQGNNNGYPPHMYFDPQYPGWYYDMNIQEWLSLDAYNSQVTDQNSFSANNSYYGNDQLVGKQQQSWQPDTINNIDQQKSYGSNFRVDNNVNQQQSYAYGGAGSSYNKSSQVRNEFPAVSGSQSFGSSGTFGQPFGQSMMGQNDIMNATKAYGNQNQFSSSQQSVVHQSGHQKSYGSTVERSSAGQPPHALATFGFGGKLIVMKNTSAVINASYGGLDSSTRSISVLNLAEVVTGVGDMSSSGAGVRGYFHTLCRQLFPGPLAGGNVSGRELNRWIDERITHPSEMDYKKDQVLRLLLSLLKIASQHYGKLRSPFGTDTTTKESDAPDVAVARLFASAKNSNAEYGNFGAFANCVKQLPSEGQTRAAAAEVQTLLVSGRKTEALHRAQEGQLWGLALVLAVQLGDQFYVDTVRNMALHQLVAGSPLRTLCLLIAGHPAEVFSTDIPSNAGSVNMFQQPTHAQLGANALLKDWEENLAVITANRTKDDELVLIHLGDCLWKETSNIIAAHICYLVAEANFEPYSDSARLCLIGADHWKHPRTYASPEAIQRTEVYEYSKLLGNSQFTLLPFQPYKFIYANMLAEVGRVSDSLKYCQVISKSLKTGRASGAPEVETWRHMVISLEERIKGHQEGGFSSNLARKLLNLFDSTSQRAHRVHRPPPVPSSTTSSSAQNDHHHHPTGPRVSSSQSTMAMSSLDPSASTEPITQTSEEGNNRRIMHNRSVSEPDFGRSPRQKQDDSSKQNSGDSQSKPSTSRFGGFGFGSQLFQKTVGLVLKPRQDKQAKLGETNKFYYDDKLKRWVEEGVDPPAEEAALPPPPTSMTSFQASNYASKSASKSEGSLSNGSSDFSSGNTTVGHSSGIPPIPASSSQFSARGRMGVRARYVDTFNQGGGNATKLFPSPSPAPAPVKPVTNTNPKFFVPKAAPSVDQPTDTFQENPQQITPADSTHLPLSKTNPFQPPSYQSSMQRFASMDNIAKGGIIPSFPSTSSGSPHSRRTASWGGSMDERFTVSSSERKPNGDVFGVASQMSFRPSEPPGVALSSSGDGFNDDLQEVEL